MEITAATLAEKDALAESLARQVRERTRELEELAYALSLAEERERQAVAAELHDELAQLLALLKLKLHELMREETSTPSSQAIERILDLVDRADRRVRSLSSQLSNPVLHQFGLIAALDSLADEMQRDYDLKVDFSDDGIDKTVPSATNVILYRAVRELLINVAKHAQTTRAEVSCRVETHREGQSLVIVVSDRGRGFAPADLKGSGTSPGLGLRLIRERLQFVGGKFTIASIPGDGVEAVLSVPLAAQADAAAVPGDPP